MRNEAEGAVCLLSGGLNSTVALYWAKTRFDFVKALAFDYRQKHVFELASATKIAKEAGVDLEVINVWPFVGNSPLIGGSQLYLYETFDAAKSCSANQYFVPGLNMTFISMAVNRAVAWGCSAIVAGFSCMDEIFSDYKEDFLSTLEGAINLGIGNSQDSDYYIRLYTPLMYMYKSDIVAMGRTMPECWNALAFTHSCDAGECPPCGRCRSCWIRKEAFDHLKLQDPLIERLDQLMDISDTWRRRDIQNDKVLVL